MRYGHYFLSRTGVDYGLGLNSPFHPRFGKRFLQVFFAYPTLGFRFSQVFYAVRLSDVINNHVRTSQL